MNTQPQGFFGERTNQLDANNKLPNFPVDFVGRCRIDACKGITTGKGDRAFIAELTVLTSNRPDVFVGGRYSWFQGNLQGQYADTAAQACIGFLLAAINPNPTDLATDVKPRQAEYLNAAIDEKRQLLRGMEVNLQTSEKKKKDGKMLSIEECRTKGLIFTLHTFSPAPPVAAVAA
jgi:hypothetical protein